MPTAWSPNTGDIKGAAAVTNVTAVTDPGAGNDSTQGYTLGSMWYNVSANFKRIFICLDNTSGAAKWAFLGCDYVSGGLAPPTEAVQAGSSTASIAAEGNINREVLAVPGRQPPAAGSNQIVGMYVLPASFFDGALVVGGTAVGSRSLLVTASGSIGATGNTKRIQLLAGASGTLGGVPGGGSVIADTGSITTNGSGWFLQGKISKVGALGSNTQVGTMLPSQAGTSVLPLAACVALTLNEAAAINIMVVMNLTTATNDAGLTDFEVAALN